MNSFPNYKTLCSLKKRIAIFLLISAAYLLVTGIVCDAEENQPPIFLPTGNFHPQSYKVAFIQSPPISIEHGAGPVLFPPPTTIITANENPHHHHHQEFNNPIVSIGGHHHHHNLNGFQHPTTDNHNRHPYAKVAQKYQSIIPGRFNRNGIYHENHVNFKVYEALSQHANKVLAKAPSQLRHDYVTRSSSLPHFRPKNYAFAYKVVDHFTGDDYSHVESQHAGAKNGEYRVRLPDGRIQIVSYKADKNGYNADVKYIFEDNATPNRISPASVAYAPVVSAETGRIPTGITPPTNYDFGGASASASIIPHRNPLDLNYESQHHQQHPPYVPQQLTEEPHRFIYATAIPKTLKDYAVPLLHPEQRTVPQGDRLGQTHPETIVKNAVTNTFTGYLSSTAEPFLVQVVDDIQGASIISSTRAPQTNFARFYTS